MVAQQTCNLKQTAALELKVQRFPDDIVCGAEKPFRKFFIDDDGMRIPKCCRFITFE